MKKFTYFYLISFFAAVQMGTAEETKKLLEISSDKFVQMVLGKSYNFQIVKDNFQSSKYLFSATRRDILAPRFGVSSQVSRSKSIQSTSLSLTDSLSSRAQLTQPFIWGGDLSLSGSGDASERVNDTIVDGKIVSSIGSFNRTFPQFSASYKQPLYIFVRNQRIRSWKRNNLTFKNARSSFERELQTIEFDARAQYNDALVALARLEVEKKKLKSSEILFQISKALVDAGKSAPVELTRAQISLKLDQRRYRNAETALKQTINSLKNLVLIPEDQEVVLTSKLQYFPFNLSLETLQDVALKYRLDLRNARENIELAKLSISETKETTFPQLSANASYKFDTTIMNERPESWDVSASLDWPFFDSRINALRVKEKRIAYENAKRQLELLTRQVSNEVQNAYLDLIRTEEQIADFSETRKQAENNLAAVRIRYERGLDRLIDVFDAESKLRELDIEYLSLLSSFNKSQDRLSLLVGKKLTEITNYK